MRVVTDALEAVIAFKLVVPEHDKVPNDPVPLADTLPNDPSPEHDTEPSVAAPRHVIEPNVPLDETDRAPLVEMFPNDPVPEQVRLSRLVVPCAVRFCVIV